MCVIFLADIAKPTPEMVEKAYDKNPAGAGIAYRASRKVRTPEGGHKLIDVVRWKKGLSLEEIQALVEQVELPFVTHFRIPSCGGDSKSLCHPFPVEKDSTLALEGETQGLVLFHNGHWGKWRETVLEAVTRHNLKLPEGAKWSDSRAMAWFAALHGIGILEMIDEKVVTFGPGKIGTAQNIEIFGNGWKRYKGGAWASNELWDSWSGGKGTTHYPIGGSRKEGKSEAQNSGKGSSLYTTPPASMAGGSKDTGKASNTSQTKQENSGSGTTETPGASDDDSTSTAKILGPQGGRSKQGPFQFASLDAAETAFDQKLISKKTLKRWRKKFQGHAGSPRRK